MVISTPEDYGIFGDTSKSTKQMKQWLLLFLPRLSSQSNAHTAAIDTKALDRVPLEVRAAAAALQKL